MRSDGFSASGPAISRYLHGQHSVSFAELFFYRESRGREISGRKNQCVEKDKEERKMGAEAFGMYGKTPPRKNCSTCR